MSTSINVQTLGQCAAATTPAVVTMNDHIVVVLDYVTADTVEVWNDGVVASYHDSTVVTELTDPRQRQALVRQAVLGLNDQRSRAIRQIEQEAEQHAVVLRRIRAYAIATHRRGTICRPGLNEFLDHFGLELYDPHVSIGFTLTGRYDVCGPSLETACIEAVSLLGLTPEAVCGLTHDAVWYEVAVTDAVTLPTDGDQPRIQIRFAITGRASVRSSDTDRVRSDVVSFLRGHQSIT